MARSCTNAVRKRSALIDMRASAEQGTKRRRLGAGYPKGECLFESRPLYSAGVMPNSSRAATVCATPAAQCPVILATPLQCDPATCLARLSSACTRGLCSGACCVAACATSISCAGHASVAHATKPKLTSYPDHSVGRSITIACLLLSFNIILSLLVGRPYSSGWWNSGWFDQCGRDSRR